MYLHGRRLNKKVFLGVLFLIQIFLIGLFVAFGSICNETVPSPSDTAAEFNVQFVRVKDKANGTSMPNQHRLHRIKIHTDGSFAKEFIRYSNGTKLCFRNGGIVQHNIDGEEDECKCLVEYHGKDCGQPEVLWRAFMTSKIQLKLTGPRQEPHKIFYIINTTDVSIETLEMQFLELINVVDLFILCDAGGRQQWNGANDATRLSIKQYIDIGVFKKFIHKILIVDTDHCSPKFVYRKFRQSIDRQSINGEDILIFSNADEILNWRAIKYFKWYDNWPQPVRFRFKYNVFGYYWQHPDNTIVGSLVCQINILDEIYKADPERIIETMIKPGMIVGDLNHFGGWYCQYCYHPTNIVKRLLADGKDVFLDHKKMIDSIYIERLIANGIYVDGRIELKRLHRYTDKYYAPDHITNSSWKYESLLTNIYASYDDDYVE